MYLIRNEYPIRLASYPGLFIDVFFVYFTVEHRFREFRKIFYQNSSKISQIFLINNSSIALMKQYVMNS